MTAFLDFKATKSNEKLARKSAPVVVESLWVGGGRGPSKSPRKTDTSEETAISIGHILLIEFTSHNKNVMKFTQPTVFYFLGK